MELEQQIATKKQELDALIAQLAARDASPAGKCWKHKDASYVFKVINIPDAKGRLSGITVTTKLINGVSYMSSSLADYFTEIPAAEFDDAFRATMSKLASDAGVTMPGAAELEEAKRLLRESAHRIFGTDLAVEIKSFLARTK